MKVQLYIFETTSGQWFFELLDTDGQRIDFVKPPYGLATNDALSYIGPGMTYSDKASATEATRIRGWTITGCFDSDGNKD